jgi:hypothetical protein
MPPITAKGCDTRLPRVARRSPKLGRLAKWLAALILLFGLGSTQDAFARPKHAKHTTAGHGSSAKRSSATGAKSAVGVLPIDGPNAGRLRSAAVAALVKQKRKVKTVTAADVDGAADQSNADPNSATGRVAIAKELTLSALVGGQLRKRGKTVELRVSAYDGASGQVLGSATFHGAPAAVERQVRTRLWIKLAKAIARGRPPSNEAPVPAGRAQRPPVEEPEESTSDELSEDESTDELEEETTRGDRENEEEEVAERESGKGEARTQNPLELSAGIRLMTRSYEYNDALVDLAQHTLDPTPALRLEARWYPAAHFTSGVIANLGLDLYAQMMWPVTATSAVGEFDTSSTAFGISARFRVPLGKHELGILAGYSIFGFYFEDAENSPAQVPSVTYGSIRLGADARFQLTDSISVGLQAAYLMVQGFGELGTAAWWPDVSGNGLEVEVRGGYAISKPLELTLSLGLTRYAMSLNPSADNPAMTLAAMRAVGGLTDQYLHGALGIRWVP